ncbi:MAG: phage tail protein [Pseudomonas sp.]|uniref:phage tail protein n=1 Tax=Pseudomonas sp. TaxID=306 RepID=UPI003D6DC883
MIDQNSQFFAILTAVGEAKQANADALGIPWKLTHLGVGDANGTDPIPDRLQTRLLNERRRAPLNQLKIDPANPAVLIAEQVIPADVGGWWVREIGLYDEAGDLVAIANCAPSFKPVLSQGSGRTQIVRMNFIVSSVGNVVLKIDPSVVLATREYVDSSIIAVLPANKVAGTFTKVTTNNRGVVQSGSNPTTLAGYGITDGFAATLAATDYNALLKSGLYILGDGNAANRPVKADPSGSYGAVAFNHVINSDYGYTLSYNLGVDDIAFRRRKPDGYGDWQYVWHTGNYNPDNKADKATSLAGYGIPIATQLEAETGADTNKPMSALRVFQAIAAKVVQATESALGTARIATQTLVTNGTDDSTIVTPKKLRAAQATQLEAQAGTDNSKVMTPLRVFQAIANVVYQATESAFGWAKVATQALTNAGVDDATFITPKKLRFGFSVSLTANGYVVFPSWLSGLIIQWGTTTTISAGGAIAHPLVLAYPNANLVGVAMAQYSSAPNSGFMVSIYGRTLSSMSFYNSNTGSALVASYISVGY